MLFIQQHRMGVCREFVQVPDIRPPPSCALTWTIKRVGVLSGSYELVARLCARVDVIFVYVMQIRQK